MLINIGRPLKFLMMGLRLLRVYPPQSCTSFAFSNVGSVTSNLLSRRRSQEEVVSTLSIPWKGLESTFSSSPPSHTIARLTIASFIARATAAEGRLLCQKACGTRQALMSWTIATRNFRLTAGVLATSGMLHYGPAAARGPAVIWHRPAA